MFGCYDSFVLISWDVGFGIFIGSGKEGHASRYDLRFLSFRILMQDTWGYADPSRESVMRE